ncbi:hypothetical protein DKT77_03650 [Meridianimarinicoccus roseus]|jgi:glycosyltransferase involved in cell wall biosynthesis|uniref:Glycosyltransferase 2-like domain-containing protein n=1 Tax=Meridianimarinicoccus roseus TaxID=2072018 RepID=A0A2V2LKD0_9RHOB|nr:glycosyltransferase family 2 protein [Meridianimarinicoccus roseus]PWR03984.1 hypothetical protein DKT77_03650 [Meridianimarinicoccus roseus]
MAMTFSVILPTYNRGATLIPALESILSQTRPADEIIVIDDGSEEDPSPLLAPYMDRIIFRRQPNGGVANARNNAAALATGDWLSFQDSDDLWDKDHLLVAERDLSRADPDVVCHIGDVTYVGDGYRESLLGIKNMTFPSDRATRLDDPLGLVISGMTLQAAAIRRDVFARLGGFDEEMRMLSDTALFCLLALEGAFLVTGHNMADILRAEGDTASITSMNRTKRLYALQMRVRILEPLCDRALTAEQAALVMPRLSGARFRLAHQIAATDASAAWPLLFQAAREHPSRLRGWGKSAVAFAFGQKGYRWMSRSSGMLDRS